MWSEKAWHNEGQGQGYYHLGPHQRVNHFPNNYEVSVLFLLVNKKGPYVQESKALQKTAGKRREN
jgi:hypothetical protein